MYVCYCSAVCPTAPLIFLKDAGHISIHRYKYNEFVLKKVLTTRHFFCHTLIFSIHYKSDIPIHQYITSIKKDIFTIHKKRNRIVTIGSL